MYDHTSDLKFAWGDFKKLNKSDLKSTALPKLRNHSSGVVCCLRCGLWFKSKHGKGSCDANRPKDLGVYSFEVPQQLRETCCISSVAPEAAADMAHPPDEQFVDPTDWETEFFSELEPQKIFSSPGTLQSLPRDTRTLFSTLVKDLVSLALVEKKRCTGSPLPSP